MTSGRETLTFVATGDGVNPGTFKPVGGVSNRVRDAKKVALLSLAASQPGIDAPTRYSVRSPLLHDAQVGLGIQSTGNVGSTYFDAPQQLVAQDDLVIVGGVSKVVTAHDVFMLNVGYEDLPGVDGIFLDRKDLGKRAEDYYTFQVDLIPGSGIYGAAVTINSLEDQLKANREYAILGVYGLSNPVYVRLRAVDWGNLGIVASGNKPDPSTYGRQFLADSDSSGVASVPVFNASNKDSFLVDALSGDDANAIATTIYVNSVLLKKGR